MRDAWNRYHQMKGWRRTFDRKLFAIALRCAWSYAKKTAKIEKPAPTHPDADRINAAIFDLNMKDRWTAADHEHHSKLQAQLRSAA